MSVPSRVRPGRGRPSRAESQAELAKNDAERAKRLIATKAISEEDFDTKTRTYASAEAAVKSAKAALDSARLNREFTEIRSPINGRIGRALVTEGNLVSGGLGGTGATLLTTIVSQDRSIATWTWTSAAD